MTAVMCLFIVNKKKRSRKIDKRKRKLLVSKHTITIGGLVTLQSTVRKGEIRKEYRDNQNASNLNRKENLIVLD